MVENMALHTNPSVLQSKESCAGSGGCLVAQYTNKNICIGVNNIPQGLSRSCLQRFHLVIPSKTIFCMLLRSSTLRSYIYVVISAWTIDCERVGCLIQILVVADSLNFTV